LTALDLQGARDLFEKTLIARRRVLGDDHRWTLHTMSYLAETLRALGDLRGALTLHEQTLDARQRVLGPDHPDTVASTNNLAAVRGEP
jgi:hypothetical protein